MSEKSIPDCDTESQPLNSQSEQQLIDSLREEFDRLKIATEPEPELTPLDLQPRPYLALEAHAHLPPYARRLRLHPGEPIHVYCGDATVSWCSAQNRNQSDRYACDALVWPHNLDPHTYQWPVQEREVTVLDNSRQGLGAQALEKLAEALLLSGAIKVYVISQSAPANAAHLAIFNHQKGI